MLPSVFTVGDIDFIKAVFLKPITHLFFARLSIGIAKKQALLTHFGDATFDAMRDVIPFRSHSVAPFWSPKSIRSCFSNIDLPLCCTLPSHHTVTLSDNIPLPLDAGALYNTLDALGCVELSWLTKNLLLDLWMQGARNEPYTCVLI